MTALAAALALALLYARHLQATALADYDDEGCLLLEAGEAPRRFVHLSAPGYPSGLYGSQKFHRAESGLSPAAIVAERPKAAA